MRLIIAIVLSLLFTATQVSAQTAGIISKDTTWQAGSTITLTGNIQVAHGSTLTIGEGAIINANGFDIQIFGTLKALGSQFSKITFNNGVFKFGANHMTNGRMEIAYSRLIGGKFLPATGNASYGSFQVSDSIFSSVSGFYIWYPTSESSFLRNSFFDSDGLSIGTRHNVTVRNNLFLLSKTTVNGVRSAVESWATYDGANVSVSQNSIYVSSGYALALNIDGSMSANNNYFGTDDESKIALLVLDKADSLNLGSVINTSYLKTPHPDTPVNTPPVVSITGGNRTVADTNGAAGESVALTATASDGDGAIATTQWLVAGQVVATGASASLTLADGATTVTFRAIDNGGATASGSAVITVIPANIPPVVSIIGGNRTIADTNGIAGETVALTATATDSDGSIATTQWLVSGQVVATGTSASLALADGATTVTFRATDNSGATTSTTATITVTAPVVNLPPVVAITGGNRTVADTNTAAGESVVLTATATDSDGTIASSQWLVNGQVVATGTSATLALVDGATTVTFRATDNSGATTSTTATITVTAPVVNVPPVVAITGGNRTVADTNSAAGESVALTATATDSDGSIASTQWLVAGQVVATGTSATLALADGATTVTFRATDNSGATTSTTATITVTAPVVNVPPVVAITGGSRTIADTNSTPGESVALTATATDSDGTIASTEWLINGQVVATGTSATISLADGATLVTFRATDNSGATTSTSVDITVGSVEVQPAEYLGTYNGVAVDPRYNLEVNQVGLIIIDRSRLHSCVRIFENSLPAQVAGMNKIDVTFNILSLDTGAIQIVATRPFSDQSSTDAQPAECSGRFETTTGIYRDYINLGTQLFDASFRLVNDNTLEFSLVDAQEVLIKN